MKPTTSNEIRQAFLDFFAEMKHEVVASAPLPQYDNPTLLFTNAGMNQFVDLFLGKEKRSYSRAATAQKVMRVQGKHNDLENVGPSPRHHTYFEMLGNFSFGDYFKREAIDFAWNFITGVLELDTERVWATVYEDDDESFELWQKYLPAEKVLRFDEKDNFWEMGETGPCGPNSEMFYYVGDMATCDPSRLNADDDQEFLEFWNLVFMQFNREEDRSLTPLPRPSVDTGMGFERMVRIMQNAKTNYETDLFVPAMDQVQKLLGDSDSQRIEHEVGYRVIADHGRAATFLIGDGLRPSSTGAGYVLRMITRRAARFGRKIGFEEPFLAKIAQVYIDQMGDAFPELKRRSDQIKQTLTQEETRFARTLDSALIHLNEITEELKAAGESEIEGDVAFNLYATYGLPLEITRDVVQEQGFTVDEAGYTAARATHAAASGSGAFSEYTADTGVYGELLNQLTAEGGVEYDPYGAATLESEVVGIIRDGQLVDAVSDGEKIEIVTSITPFYVESGGEISDTGFITGKNARFRVEDTRKPMNGLVVQVGKMVSGTLAVGQLVTMQVDNTRRSDIRRNHTATHILHRELRAHLGTHVEQQGSLVAPDRLRFDFSNETAVDKATLATIEADINKAIQANYPVAIKHMGKDAAIDMGAMALFGEKYGDIVRTVNIGGKQGSDTYSFELCGGLHVAETGDIDSFRFISEGAVGAGIRRIEAVTGRGAQALIKERFGLLDRVAAKLNSPISEVEARLDSLLESNKAQQKQLALTQRKLARSQFEGLLTQVQQVKGANVLAAQVDVSEVENLREMTDWFRDKLGSGTAVLAMVSKGKPVIIATVTDDLIKRGLKAGDLVREVAKMVGGGGGGRPNMAQAGGRDASKLPGALTAVAGLVEERLGD